MSSGIKDWLNRNGLGEHIEAFVANEIDLDSVRDLTEVDLRELGIAMGPRKKLMRAIAAIQTDPTEDENAPVQPVEPSRSGTASVRGERRQVTVLFADISGYTQLSHEIDAEEAHELLSAYFRAVDKIVESFGGSVDKHIGDSTMAVFGAPVAHGNEQERAVRAAISIHQAMPHISEQVGRPIMAHIGIASGQVVASGVGNDDHYTVTGDSVNLASRLTDKAKAGETYLSAAVQEALGPDCISEKLGALDLKGISDPVATFRLLSYGKSDSTSEQVQARPFVGRQVEMQQFSAVLSACADTGNGHVVYLRGEAGIGKTRLSEEFEAMSRKSGFRPHRALVLDFGVGKGQDAIRSLVRNLLSQTKAFIDEDWSTVAERAISENLVSQNQSVFLNDLLDLEQPPQALSLYNAMDSGRRNQGKRDTVANLLRTLSERGRLILFVEDVHWADKLVINHLSEIARSIADVPVILVMTSRIEGDQLDEVWRATAATTPMMTIDLRPLPASDAMKLATGYIETTNQFALSCVERADGNPLFLEQLLRSAETASEKGVPASVQSIVQARTDSLEPTDKEALQAASILGQRFSLDALRQLIGSSQYDCGSLIHNYLVRPDGDDFLFAHALVRDGVYNSLLTSSRNDLHRQAAQWYQNRDLTLCAQHLDRADDTGAGRAYLLAAQAQVDALHFETVVKLSRRGIEVQPEREVQSDLGCMLADALLNTGETDAAIAAYEAALGLADDDERQCLAWIGWASALRIAGQQESALELLDQAEAAAKRQDMTAQLAHVHYLRGNLFFPLGQIEQCMAEHEKSLNLAQQIGSYEAEAHALSGLADAHYLRCHMATAFESFEACVTISQEHGFAQIEVNNRHMMGWTRIHLMEFREALEDAQAAIRMAGEVRSNRALMFGHMLAGIVERRLGHIEVAEGHLECSLELSNTMGSRSFSAQTLSNLAMIRFGQGRQEEARDLNGQALDLVRNAGMTFIGPSVLAISATLTDDLEQKKLALSEAEAILDDNCVAHNHVFFAETAINDALCGQNWEAVLKYAARLESYTQGQPLNWSDFIIARARALVARGRGEKHAALDVEIAKLVLLATEAGLNSALPALQEAATV